MAKSSLGNRIVKWGLIVSFSFLGIVIALVSMSSTPEPKPITREEWLKQKSAMETFVQSVKTSKNPFEMFGFATEYSSDQLFGICKHDVCRPYKKFMETAKSASADGVLTPKEMLEIAQRQLAYNEAVKAADQKYK